jgi:hypothetical protein
MMAFDTVNVGTTANDGTGDTPRVGMQKVNANFALAVEAPASTVTDGRVAVFDGTTGKLLKQASVLVTDLLALSGGTMTGAIVTDKQVQTTLATLGTSGTITVDLTASMLQTTGTLTGNITSLVTSNRAAGRSATLRIINGATNRTVAYSASWRWVGTKPASGFTLNANKIGILTLTAFGANETDIVAAWAVEP